MTPQEKRDAWRGRKRLPLVISTAANAEQIEAPRHDPWAPKRDPAFERRLTKHKLTLVKMLGGKVAT
jgi:ABC-type siderophore export system fused ATPase/permease subunit